MYEASRQNIEIKWLAFIAWQLLFSGSLLLGGEYYSHALGKA
jgi:hypothetical protein